MKNCSKCNAAKPASDYRPGRNQCKRCEADAQLARKGGGPEPLNAEEARIHNRITSTRARFPYAQAVLDKIFDDEDVRERESEIIVSEVEKLSPVEEHRLKVKNSELQRQVKSLTEQLSNAQVMADFAREAAEAAANVEPITIRERTSGLREGTVQVLASDWHIEEEVRPEQVAGRNRYNLDISKERMDKFFQATMEGIRLNRQAYKIRDMIMWLGGDLITNYLHDDNVESNLLSPVQAIAYAFAEISAGIRLLLTDPEMERFVFVCNDGNHGRLTEKTRSATRVANSIEWLLYKMLADAFATEPRVEFVIAEGSQIYFDVYGRTIRYTHGDETKYGGGVGGITIPIYKAMARWQTVRHADLTVMGHYHQRTNLNDLIINGSLIGYGPYSLSIGARFEPPIQDLSILDAKRWRGPSFPLWVSERSDDDFDNY